jgi:hypothetical protein
MFHVVYVSSATRPFTEADAEEVLQEARAFNAEHGVTGLLVHTATGGFLQVLEGEADAIEAAFRRAAASSRHETVLRTPALPVAERVFPTWSMGFERALPGQLVEHVLQPLVDHQLLTSSQVRTVLLERWGVTSGQSLTPR